MVSCFLRKIAKIYKNFFVHINTFLKVYSDIFLTRTLWSSQSLTTKPQNPSPYQVITELTAESAVPIFSKDLESLPTSSHTEY